MPLPRNTVCFVSSASPARIIYPKKSFRSIALPQAVKRVVLAA
jgi:hypothetical protein